MSVGIIYTRVSTKEQAVDKTSLSSQEKECKQQAQKDGVLIPDQHIFRERGESAKFIDRTELQRLLKFVKDNRGKVNTLYIWKIDRLARNLGDYYGIKVALAKYEVKIVSVTEPIDDDPVGRFLEAILAAAAQFDNEIRAIRTVTGMRVRVEQGKWPHSAPIGYKKQNGRIVADPEYADKIVKILNRFSLGQTSLAEISRYAYELGVKTVSGKPKSIDAMKKILQNLIYAGYTRNKLSPKVHRGLHKPLVDEKVIYSNIELINGQKKAYVLRGDDLYPLRGTLLCSNCGHKLTASAPKGRSGSHYARYHCNQSSCKKSITGKKASGDSDIAHAKFRELLEEKRPITGFTRLYKAILVKAWNDEYKDACENASRIDQEIAMYRDLRFKTIEKFTADKISEDDKNAQVSNIDTLIKDLQQDKQDVDAYVREKEQIIDDAMQFIDTPDIFWNHAKTDVRQDIQKLLFPNGLVYNFETGFGTTNIQMATSVKGIKKDLSESEKSHLVSPTGLGWNTLHESIVELDRKLEELGLEVISND